MRSIGLRIERFDLGADGSQKRRLLKAGIFFSQPPFARSVMGKEWLVVNVMRLCALALAALLTMTHIGPAVAEVTGHQTPNTSPKGHQLFGQKDQQKLIQPQSSVVVRKPIRVSKTTTGEDGLVTHSNTPDTQTDGEIAVCLPLASRLAADLFYSSEHYSRPPPGPLLG